MNYRTKVLCVKYSGGTGHDPSINIFCTQIFHGFVTLPLSLLGYLGATVHGLFAGTDSALPITMVLYMGTFLIVIFITVYIMLLVTFTFYLRQQIGGKAFRAIHVLSLLGYLGTTVHGLFAGTDSALPVTMVLYVGTFLIVVFMTIYWLFTRYFGREKLQIFNS
jgi:predicted ferric reductase